MSARREAKAAQSVRFNAGPDVPTHLVHCFVEDWIQPRELPPADYLIHNRTPRERACLLSGDYAVAAFNRRNDAGRAWAAEHGTEWASVPHFGGAPRWRDWQLFAERSGWL